jgi:hypothetical protein
MYSEDYTIIDLLYSEILTLEPRSALHISLVTRPTNGLNLKTQADRDVFGRSRNEEPAAPGRMFEAPMSLSPKFPAGREAILKKLEEIDRQIALGKEHIAKQREMIEELDREGHDTSAAKELLETFLATQAAHEERQRTLIEDLGGTRDESL